MNKVAAPALLLAVPNVALASGDPAVLLFPVGMLVALGAIAYFAWRSSPKWPIRISVALIGIAAMVPALFSKGSAMPITYFVLGFAPGAVTAYIASRLFQRNQHGT